MVIKAISSNVQEVGKLVKKSKKIFNWHFMIDGLEYQAELAVSYVSGKKKVTLNGDLIFECKKKLNNSFQFPFQIDVNMCQINQTGEGFELKINNHSFEDLQKGVSMGGGIHSFNKPNMINFNAHDEQRRIQKTNQIILEATSKDQPQLANQLSALKGNRASKVDQPQQSNNTFGSGIGGLNTIDFNSGQQNPSNTNNFNNQFGNMNLNNNNNQNNMGFGNNANNNMGFGNPAPITNMNTNTNNNDFADLFNAFGNTGANNNMGGGFNNNANNNMNGGFNDFNFGNTNNNNQFGNNPGATSNAFVNLNAGNNNVNANPLPANFISLDDPKPKESKKKNSKDDFVAPVYQVNTNTNYNNPPVQNTKPEKVKEEKPKKEDKKDKKKDKEEKNKQQDQQQNPINNNIENQAAASNYVRPSQNLAKLLGMNMDMSKIAGTTKRSQQQTGSRGNIDE